jgi:uroporphyrin-III C-methyltransferase/precorrin-2 dehydrogenase/sirohydrochlorin ferrochelatase
MQVNVGKVEDSRELKGPPDKASSRLPLFVSLHQRRVVVVGGGNVAASKLSTLLSAGAAVTLIAPQIVPQVAVAGVTIHRRLFRERDLDGAWFVVAAATPLVNAKVARAAARRRIFANAVDDPDNATAYFGGVVKRGDITLAISSGGSAPGLVRLLRESLDDILPQELADWIDMTRSERQQWLRQRVNVADRVPLLAAAIGRLYSHE